MCLSSVQETGSRVSAPVLKAPMRDLLVAEGLPAQFQCTVSGEGREHAWFKEEKLSEHCVCSPLVVRGVTLLSDDVSADLQVSWFYGDREVRDSDVFRMSRSGETYQLDISKTLSKHEGEYSSMASNAAGRVTCAATLNIDGE